MTAIALITLMCFDMPVEVLKGWNDGLSALEGFEFELNVKDSRSGMLRQHERVFASRSGEFANAFMRMRYSGSGIHTIEFENESNRFQLQRDGEERSWTVSRVSQIDKASPSSIHLDSINNGLFEVFGGVTETGINNKLKTGAFKVVTATKGHSGEYTIELELPPRGNVPGYIKIATESGPYFPVRKAELVAGGKPIRSYAYEYDGDFGENRLPRLKNIVLDEYQPSANAPIRKLEVKVLYQGPSRRSPQDYDLSNYGIPSAAFQNSAPSVSYRYYALAILATAFIVWVGAKVFRRFAKTLAG